MCTGSSWKILHIFIIISCSSSYWSSPSVFVTPFRCCVNECILPALSIAGLIFFPGSIRILIYDSTFSPSCCGCIDVHKLGWGRGCLKIKALILRQPRPRGVGLKPCFLRNTTFTQIICLQLNVFRIVTFH